MNIAKTFFTRKRKIFKINLAKITGTWYGWLVISAALAGVIVLMGFIDVHYSVLLATTALTAIAGFISFIRLVENKDKSKKTKSKKATLKALLGDLVKVAIFIISGLLIGGVSIGATLERYDKQYAANEQQKEPTSLVENTIPASTQQKEERRYQYMHCSTGHYRYFTDEEFKNPNTGFTNDSPDYCAQNNEGTKTQLADAPPGRQQANVPAYVPSECTKEIVPFGTSYLDDPFSPAGERRAYGGSDGYKYVCSPGSDGYISALDGMTVDPYDQTVYVGTGTAINQPSQSQQNPVARQKCITDYNNALAQLRMHNATGSSAMQQLQQLHAQCLASAGY